MTALILRSFFAPFVVCAVLVWGVRVFSIRANVYDPPGPLKIHQKPIPRLGGVGLTIGFLVGTFVPIVAERSGKFYLLTAVLLVWVTGLLDDLTGLPPIPRLLVHAVAGILVFKAGLFGLHNSLPIIQAGTACVAVIVLINAFNFLDGSDGLAAGIAALSAAGFGLLFMREDPAFAAIAISLATSCFGFLLFNFPPASIFMGDCGSTVLGLVLAALSIRAISEPRIDRVIIALLLMAIPLFDFASVLIRRVLAGQSVLAGDRSHYYDILLRRGWTPRRIALTSYLAELFCLTAGFAVRAGRG